MVRRNMHAHPRRRRHLRIRVHRPFVVIVAVVVVTFVIVFVFGTPAIALLCFAMLRHASLCFPLLCMLRYVCFSMLRHALLCLVRNAFLGSPMLGHPLLCFVMLCNALICLAMLGYDLRGFTMLCYRHRNRCRSRRHRCRRVLVIVFGIHRFTSALLLHCNTKRSHTQGPPGTPVSKRHRADGYEPQLELRSCICSHL